jgi:hypothetical protein
MTPVLVRLAFAGLRHRALQAVLTVLVVSAAAAALTIAVGIDRVADRSWDRTFEATNGAHVTVFSGPGGTDAAAIEQLPGVTGSTGDVALVQSMFRRDGKRYGVMLLGTAGHSRRRSAGLSSTLGDGRRLGARSPSSGASRASSGSGPETRSLWRARRCA